MRFAEAVESGISRKEISIREVRPAPSFFQTQT